MFKMCRKDERIRCVSAYAGSGTWQVTFSKTDEEHEEIWTGLQEKQLKPGH